MVDCVLIPADFDTPISRVTVDSHAEFVAILGGPVQGLFFEQPTLLLLADEEGKLKDKPRNHRASVLYWWFAPVAYRHDALVGDVLVAGVSRSDCSTEDVPAPFDRWLTEGALFHVEARGFTRPDEWTDVFGWLDDYYTALMHGIHVREHWGFAQEVRVIESNE